MRDSIFNILRNFRGLDPLKRLFWSELAFDRVNEPLSIRDWKEPEQQALASAPLLLAQHGDFHIIYVQLAAELARGPERLVVNRLLQQFPYALFVFSDEAQHHWHFLTVKCGRDQGKRRLFRNTARGWRTPKSLCGNSCKTITRTRSASYSRYTA